MFLESNNKKQFEEVYLKYYPVLLVYGKTIAANEELIEDTIQELFLSLWQKRKSLSIKTSLESYLLVAFRNNLIRKLKTKPTESLRYNLADYQEPKTYLEQEEKLKIYLHQLPPRQKEVLFLRYYKNKSYQEISEMLGIKYQVARNFSYRAIKFVKKNLKKLSCITVAGL